MAFLPFSERAKALAQSEHFSIDSRALLESQQFIEKMLAGQVKEVEASEEAIEVKKLAICKVILALCPYPLIARFADEYSRLWIKFFRSHQVIAAEFARETFPSLTQRPEYFSIGVFDYLAAEESISFVNVENGKVFIPAEQLPILLGKQVRRKVLSIPATAIFPPEVKQIAQSLSSRFALFLPRRSKQLEKDEIKQIRLGLTEGKRFYGCMKLSRACFNDGLSLEEAKQVIIEFVKACPPSKNPFTEKEAFTCLEWVYRKGKTRLAE